MFKKAVKNEKGLTLVELLAVIVVLAIVAAIAVPAIGGIIQKSKESATRADAIQIINGAKLLYTQDATAGEDTTSGNTTTKTKTYDWGKLDELVDVPNEKWDNVDVKVVFNDEGVPAISTNETGVEAGKKKIEFKNATLANINDEDKQTVVVKP
ncbi:type II secretion system protein [Priestia taiwanensis]|uniref:Prepilin-type N-terminal cleavage/methylation domain-containing protein n=1 Tax=Priestia taiwanensis TaxID=1347902 RepID=A0A917AUM5_9BACI|nr:prepilin-type N-terminal cleavage/methylation domain-containing protein [Priestia taiwanensis]MBM7363596.1 type IV pilus assembly protein PilA [Priestia taiwanensis]GGE75765.1 hypothetical protein GCM10007140_26930 [Priestia taiwanensis]